MGGQVLNEVADVAAEVVRDLYVACREYWPDEHAVTAALGGGWPLHTINGYSHDARSEVRTTWDPVRLTMTMSLRTLKGGVWNVDGLAVITPSATWIDLGAYTHVLDVEPDHRLFPRTLIVVGPERPASLAADAIRGVGMRAAVASDPADHATELIAGAGIVTLAHLTGSQPLLHMAFRSGAHIATIIQKSPATTAPFLDQRSEAERGPWSPTIVWYDAEQHRAAILAVEASCAG